MTAAHQVKISSKTHFEINISVQTELTLNISWTFAAREGNILGH